MTLDTLRNHLATMRLFGCHCRQLFYYYFSTPRGGDVAVFEDDPYGAGDDALADPRDDAAGHQHVLHGGDGGGSIWRNGNNFVFLILNLQISFKCRFCLGQMDTL